jgi:hypothetical protein
MDERDTDYVTEIIQASRIVREDKMLGGLRYFCCWRRLYYPWPYLTDNTVQIIIRCLIVKAKGSFKENRIEQGHASYGKLRRLEERIAT